MKRAIYLLAAVALLAVGCGRNQYRKDHGMVWNTEYRITYESPVPLTDSVVSTLDAVGASLDYFRKGSLLSKVNAAERCAVDSSLATVYRCARRVYDESDGYFDPTLGPAINAWGFGKGHKATKDTLNIDAMRAYVGMEKTTLAGDSIFKMDRRTDFNFSALAKGFGCDEVGRMLARNGVDNYLVEIGGEIAVRGAGPSGKKWRIAVDKPSTEMSREVSEVLEVTDCGIATSGNYRNFHMSGKESYGHILSPRRLRPVQTDVVSATVVAENTMLADAWATALMAMGSQRAINLAQRRKMAIYLILSDNSVYVSPAMKPYIVK